VGISEYGEQQRSRGRTSFSELEPMLKGLIYSILVTTALFATAAQAREGAAETDPFHPAAGRPPAIVPGMHSEKDPWGRDPFNNPLAGRTPAQTGVQSPVTGRMLTGIIFSNNVRLAILGGETHLEGSMVGDRKLVEIRMRSVVLKSAMGGLEEVFLEDFTMSK
jgi:hypothetical protein